MELQPRIQGINHAHGKSGIPEGKWVYYTERPVMHGL